MTNYALLIGIQSYLDPDISGAPFAEADVLALKKALKALGYADENLIVLTGEHATKTTAEHHVRALVGSKLTDGDGLMFYYAGHGFSREGDRYIACRDARSTDLARTSLDLDELIGLLVGGPRIAIQMYMDCPGETQVDREGKCERAGDESKGFVCFSACRPGEHSYSNPQWKHGIWAFHLIEALSGKAPAILTDERLLTAGRFQSYLAERTAVSLRATYSDRKIQTPWFRGDQEFVVADLFPVLEKKRAAASRSKANEVKDFVFVKVERAPFRSLSGFKKGIHHPPKWPGAKADQLVAELARDDLRRDVEAMHAKIRSNMRYTRKEIEVHPPAEGDASIRTPDFEYTISVVADADLSRAVFRRTLSEIRRAEVLNQEGFAETFDGSFEAISLQFAIPIPIEDVIDSYEDKNLPVQYPTDFSSCMIALEDGAEIRIAADQLELAYPQSRPLAVLAQAMRQALGSLPKLGKPKALPAPRKRIR